MHRARNQWVLLLLLAYSNVTGTPLACLYNSVIDRRIKALFSWIHLGVFHRHLRSLSICELLTSSASVLARHTDVCFSIHVSLLLILYSLLPGVTSPVASCIQFLISDSAFGGAQTHQSDRADLIHQNRCL